MKCPECTSQRVWKDGLRKTKHGGVQRYICRECGYRFSKSNNRSFGHRFHRQVGVAPQPRRMINLTTVEPLKEGPAGATTTTNADAKGKIVEYLWYLKKQGYAKTTSITYYGTLKLLMKNGVNIFDPEDVKKFIATNENWGKGRKQNVVKAYSLFLKTQKLSWEKPRYKPVEKLPFIPTENEIEH